MLPARAAKAAILAMSIGVRMASWRVGSAVETWFPAREASSSAWSLVGIMALFRQNLRSVQISV